MSYTEEATIEGQPAAIGRDPRRMSQADLNAVGHHKRPLLRAIRENCIGCCGGMEAEVRRCRIVSCPMWPYRMGTNPFFTPKPLGEEERERLAARLAAARRSVGSKLETDGAK